MTCSADAVVVKAPSACGGVLYLDYGLLKPTELLLLLLPVLFLAGIGVALRGKTTKNFTLDDVCKIKKGIHIHRAWDILGRPNEDQNYDYGEYKDVRYRSNSLFIKIIYKSTGPVDEVFIREGSYWKSIVDTERCPPQ